MEAINNHESVQARRGEWRKFCGKQVIPSQKGGIADIHLDFIA
jgi:hypothetical protein